MKSLKKEKLLRLINTSGVGMRKPENEGDSNSLTAANEYYQQVEQFAQRIRKTNDVDEMIKILDTLLNETKGLHNNNEIQNTRELRHAENKIESLKYELEELRELVHTDQMTGTYNRRGLDNIFMREAARADRYENALCVVLIDLDDFKFINDTYGHLLGDSALIHFATIAKKTIRPSDVIARYGGEEFLIILPDTRPEEAVWVMQRLQKNLSKNLLLDSENIPIKITFSGGITLRKFQETQNTVIKRADKALYRAKQYGKNRIEITA